MPEQLIYKPPPQKPKLPPDSYPFRNKSLEDLPGEIWKELPQFDGNILLSNFGRIKSLARAVLIANNHYSLKPEKILSPVLETIVMKNKKECFTVKINIGYNKKFYNIVIARWMYYLFVATFDITDKLLVVVCKDSDNTHLQPDNLLLSSRHTEIKRCFANRRRERIAFDTVLKKVVQLNNNGEIINHWPSINQAAQHLDRDSKTIWFILEGKLKNNRFNIYYDKTDAHSSC